MKLHSYWRSSTSYRVRAALNLKGARYETAGAQASAEYAVLDPGRGVPTLVLEDVTVLTQSLAILDDPDAANPAPALLPAYPIARAKVQAAARTIALDVHPVNNLRVTGELKARFRASPEQVRDWMRAGFEAMEELLPAGRDFAFGKAPERADLCIVAQAHTAHHWGLDLVTFPKITRVEAACLALPAIAAAHPDKQPGAQVDA